MQVLILQQEALHACSQVTCDEQLLHFLSKLKWSGLLKWGVQTPDQVSSISVVWNTQADQNLELFPTEAEWPLFVSFTHLEVQTQAWCARKGWWSACKKSFNFNSRWTHRFYGHKLETQRTIPLILYLCIMHHQSSQHKKIKRFKKT